jgi:hypothetical protein
MNGAGAPYGRNSSTLFVSGIYMDGRTMNVNILNNTVFNNGKNGIHCNNPNYITVRGNTSYNNLNAMSVMRWSWGSIRGFSVKGNTFFPKTEMQRGFYYTNSGMNEPTTTTVKSTLTNLGSIDSNIYNTVNPTTFNFEIYGTTGGALIQTTPLAIEGWRSVASHDNNGKKPAKIPTSYTLGSLVGANKFLNGTFTSGITGITLFGSNVLGAWDNTGKISGGSYKMSFSSPAANKYALLHAPVGAISSAKKYVLRLSTYGTTQQGIVRAYIRKSTSPYTNLTSTQTKTFVTGRVDHEFLFTAPTSAAAGSLVIEIEQNSGTTYIDNVSFYEATATLYDPAAQIRFEYNATKAAKTIALGASYTAVNGTVYSSSVTLQPFTSIILIKNATTALAKAAAVDSTVIDSTLSLMADSSLLETGITAPVDSAVIKDTAATVKPALSTTVSRPVAEASTLLLNAFPNPSPSAFNLTLQGGSADRVTIMVYTFDGKLVYQTLGTSNSRYSFGNNFAPGVYILKVIQGTNVQTLKIVKAGN